MAQLSYFKTKHEIGVDLHKADVARSKTLLYTTDYGHIRRAILITALMLKRQQSSSNKQQNAYSQAF